MTVPAGGWQEVGDGVYRRRYRSLDLNVGAVLGVDQVLLVDTRSWQAEAAELRRVLQRRLATEDAVRLAPFPAAVARVAIERAAVTGPAEAWD